MRLHWHGTHLHLPRYDAQSLKEAAAAAAVFMFAALGLTFVLAVIAGGPVFFR